MSDLVDPSNDGPMERENPETFDRGNPNRRCTARKKNGERCRKWAIRFGTVCTHHGGKAAQVREKAQRRLTESADRMAMKLLAIAESEKVPAYVALQAINSALDRAGVIPAQQVDVTVGLKYEQVLEGAIVETGSRADFRKSVGRPDPDPVPALPGPPVEATGIRVLGETFGGHLVIEGEAESPEGERDTGEDSKSPSVSIGNVLTPVRLPHGCYLEAEDAMSAQTEANRAFRRNMRRR